MTLNVGLTGSIASGKSTISSKFADFQIPVIDADQLAREVVNPGEKAYREIIETFGRDILLEDQTLDRKKLGAIVFTEEEKRRKLNNIVHPAIREKMIEQRDAYEAAGEKCVVLDIPLLFESRLTHFADKIMVVYVDADVQLERLIERDGYTEEEAKWRIQAQIPVKEKAESADAVIHNNGTKQDSYQQLTDILKSWQVI